MTLYANLLIFLQPLVEVCGNKEVWDRRFKFNLILKFKRRRFKYLLVLVTLSADLVKMVNLSKLVDTFSTSIEYTFQQVCG